ncbi:MAG TPA: peptide-methionine (R)-S-oxide reductase, partial [Sphingomicrobium sp.]|nr:peptide-methionine (R)-S-oxide reductase [Sphingomicrobium sp.]
MNKTEFDRRAFVSVAGAAATSLLLFAQAGAAVQVAFRVNHTPAEWKRLLGAQRFEILREAGTERPFTSPLLKEHRRGTFLCAGCAQPLFSSETKFESGTGWP